jgi:hypothetical protein
MSFFDRYTNSPTQQAAQKEYEIRKATGVDDSFFIEDEPDKNYMSELDRLNKQYTAEEKKAAYEKMIDDSKNKKFIIMAGVGLLAVILLMNKKKR